MLVGVSLKRLVVRQDEDSLPKLDRREGNQSERIRLSDSQVLLGRRGQPCGGEVVGHRGWDRAGGGLPLWGFDLLEDCGHRLLPAFAFELHCVALVEVVGHHRSFGEGDGRALGGPGV